MMDYIEFENRVYPFKTLDFPFGKRNVSCEDLNEALMNKRGDNYISDKARYIDEQFFYFVKRESLYLESNKLVMKILKEI